MSGFGRWRRRGRPGEGGITLPEILVVVAIFGLFVVVAVPAINNYIRASRVRTSNNSLISDLRAARYIAIANRTTSTVTFNASARSYSYTDIKGQTVTRRLETGIAFVTLTNTPITFKSDGALATSPPTIVIEGRVTGNMLHRFTLTVTTVGRVSSVLTRI